MTPAAPAKEKIYLFLGPTGHGVDPTLFDDPCLCLRPPALRGSVDRLRAELHPAAGTIVLVDGRFGDVPAVGHRELLDALAGGWRVWGLGSMGALRAAELHAFGMQGFGTVYAYLRDHPDAPDDEVAILHGPAPEYRPITEALVDLRAFLWHLAARETLRATDVDAILQRLAGRWFGARSYTDLLADCRAVAGEAIADAVAAHRPGLPGQRRKTRDLLAFLEDAPWR
ncbi:TfuA domain-containing protein [Frankia gtarii]|uniref:TfuA domain-containing protein n=1 Tax=Frankia gtarii TaxID=2950102 RepID=UPI0021BF2743|nr:TfuA domain-containing protein [Frankia gtarii]